MRKEVILCEMSGNSEVINSGFDFLESINNLSRKVFIAFGLVHDPKFVVKFSSESGVLVNQNEFVLSRKSYISENNTEVYGVCGRDLDAWKGLIDDLSEESKKSDELAQSLLKSIKVQYKGDTFKHVSDLLNGGQEDLSSFMNQDGTHLKLAFIL